MRVGAFRFFRDLCEASACSVFEFLFFTRPGEAQG
jgi:hypothetical protein